jgi:tight adherence protein B
MRDQLVRADLNITPSEYLGAVILLAVLLFLAIKLLFGAAFYVNIVIAIIGAYLISKAYLRSRRDHYITSFDAQMPEVALLMSNSLKAGLTVHQSFDVVAEKMEPPAGVEFRRIGQEIKFGVRIDEAMRRMMERLPSEELRMMMTMIMIQRVAGGDLAHALSVMSTAISARFKLKDEIRTMTAEARFSGIIIVILPIFVLAILNRLMEGSVARFLTNPIGWVITSLFVGIMALAFYLINKVSTIEV